MVIGSPVLACYAFPAAILTSFGEHPFAVRVFVGLVRDHALREETFERLVELASAGFVHGAGEEARIEQMQNRMLDAADILVDRQPVADGVRIGRHGRVRTAEAREVPGRIDERIHGVGLAHGRRHRNGTCDMLPGRVTVERIAGNVERHVVRKLHRQIFLRHRNDATFLTMDHRDRTAPIALA